MRMGDKQVRGEIDSGPGVMKDAKRLFLTDNVG